MARTLFRPVQIQDKYLRNDGDDTTTGTLTMAGAVIGTLSGLLKASSGTVSAASAGTDYQAPLTAGTDYLAPDGDGASLSNVVHSESDPVVGAIEGIVKADGDGNISAASAGTDYQAPLTAGTDYLAPDGDGSGLSNVVHSEADPVVGAINGLVKANGAGTISAASAGTDYQAPLSAGTDYIAPLVKTVEVLASGITAGDDYTIPGSKTYFGDLPADADDKEHSRYMDVFVNGQKMYQGATGFLRDYKEAGAGTGKATIKFEFDLVAGDVVETHIQRA